MLQSLFKRAEATMDSAIASVAARVLVAIPFLVAIGFGTAALAIYAYDRLGIVTGNLLLAGIFLLAGLIVAACVAVKQRSEGDTSAEDTDDPRTAENEEAAKGSLLEPMDRDVLAAVASAVGPVALPFVLRSVMRNLPLIAAVAAAGLVLSRNGAERPDEAEAPMQPAE